MQKGKLKLNKAFLYRSNMSLHILTGKLLTGSIAKGYRLNNGSEEIAEIEILEGITVTNGSTNFIIVVLFFDTKFNISSLYNTELSVTFYYW